MSTGRRTLEIVLSDEPDWELFDDMLIRLLDRFDARVREANDSLDERDWDLAIAGQRARLQLREGKGIRLVAEDDSARAQLERIAKQLRSPQPGKRTK
jgi:hypothetical protein